MAEARKIRRYEIGNWWRPERWSWDAGPDPREWNAEVRCDQEPEADVVAIDSRDFNSLLSDLKGERDRLAAAADRLKPGTFDTAAPLALATVTADRLTSLLEQYGEER